MKRLFQAMVLLSCTALLWNCSEDFLDTPVQGALSSDNLSATSEGVEAVLISAYSRIDGWANDWGVFGNPWGGAATNWTLSVVPSDDTHKGSNPSDQATLQDIELFQWGPSLGQPEGKFEMMYDGVRRANETINLLAANETLSDEERTRIQGEATFLRAHYHMELWKIFKNVPYIDETVTDFFQTNTVDIADQIAADFTTAASLLPETQPQVGRVTKGAAFAMLGRLRMLEGNISAAKAAFDQMNDNLYGLENCYHDFFNDDTGENGPEMIFSYQASVNDGSSSGDNGNFSERLAFPHSGSPIGCCGFNQPTQNLVNAYRTTEDGLPALDNSSDDSPTAEEPIDPRLDWVVGRDGVPYLNWGDHDPSWIRDRPYAGQYSPKKFIHLDGQSSGVGWNNNHLSPVNIPIIRYADVLLMEAEIAVEENRLEDARALVNRIRERAGNCAQGSGATPVPLDSEETDHANYVVSTYDDAWTDQNAAREAVRLERRLELALEGHRYYDLRRYGFIDGTGADYLINTLTEYLEVEETRRPYLQARARIEPKHLYMPIPSRAILRSTRDGIPTLTQNMGY